MKRLRWPRLGLRREIQILLPVTVLLLVIVSSFTLFAYRSAVELLTEERQREAAIVTRRVARELESGPWPAAGELNQQMPTASRIVIANAAGEPLRSFGPRGTGNVLGPLGGATVEQVSALGPTSATSDQLIALAPFDYQGERYLLRIDVPARELARQRQSVRVLTWFVLPTNLALLLLTLAFLPHFLRPYDTLIQTVQSVDPEAADRDDIPALVSTIEKALTHLTSAAERSQEDDILALQRALGTDLESGVALIDQEGRILSLNRAGSAMLEIEPVRDPTPVTEVLGSQPRLLAAVNRAIDGVEGVPRQELEIRTGSGERTLGFTIHTLRRDDGAVRGYLALFADLTDSRREAQARQLETSLEQLGELAAGIAHELRNSLATLRGYLNLIDRHPDEESITDYLREIRRESDHLERVVRDFLAFAQPGSTRVEAVDLEGIARAAADDPTLARVPVTVRTDGQGSWQVTGDPQLLERAIRNLLHNAAEAEREADATGPVDLRLQRTAAGEIEVLIEDRGPGLPVEVRRRLFQPFVTGRSSGVGLGLSLAHRIVTLHGGRLELEDRVGGGTRARLAFAARDREGSVNSG